MRERYKKCLSNIAHRLSASSIKIPVNAGWPLGVAYMYNVYVIVSLQCWNLFAVRVFEGI